MSFFKSRYRLEGLYFLDEPETALSPRSQLDLLHLLQTMSQAGHAQFLIATPSPILLACPGAAIFDFNGQRIETIPYKKNRSFPDLSPVHAKSPPIPVFAQSLIF